MAEYELESYQKIVAQLAGRPIGLQLCREIRPGDTEGVLIDGGGRGDPKTACSME